MCAWTIAEEEKEKELGSTEAAMLYSSTNGSFVR
jgi:hypothetical protein